MRILFMPQSGGLGLGGLSRCLAVASAALLRGHQIAFYARSDSFDLLKCLGSRLFEAVLPGEPDRTAAPNFTFADSLAIRRMQEPAYLEATIEREQQAFCAFRPDVVFTENQISAGISCRLRGIPFVATTASVNHPQFQSSLYDPDKRIRGLERSFNHVLGRLGLPEIEDVSELLHNWSALNVAPTIPELEPLVATFPNTRYVGPLLSERLELGNPGPELEKALQGAPPIYIYMSRGTLRPETYVPELVSAFQECENPVICSIRDSSFEGKTLPCSFGNVHLFSMVPGTVVIQKSCAVITRGGQNTLMSVLLAGTPVACFPGDSAEAHFNAIGLASRQAALVEPNTAFNRFHLPSVVTQLRNGLHFSQNTLALGSLLRKYGGAGEVVSLLEKL